jgi:multidrug efflux pump subunit AcrA (membrane-fusion protein)
MWVKVLATLAQVGARHQADQLHGKIQYLAPGLDPTTRILQARIEAANPGERLKRPNPPPKSSFPAQPAQTA